MPVPVSTITTKFTKSIALTEKQKGGDKVMQDDMTVGISEAARILGVSPSTIINWTKSGRLDLTYSVSGQRRIPLSSIDEIKRRSTIDAVERRKQQTQAARDALARKRGGLSEAGYTDEDAESFDSDEESPIRSAFTGYEVKLKPDKEAEILDELRQQQRQHNRKE